MAFHLRTGLGFWGFLGGRAPSNPHGIDESNNPTQIPVDFVTLFRPCTVAFGQRSVAFGSGDRWRKRVDLDPTSPLVKSKGPRSTFARARVSAQQRQLTSPLQTVLVGWFPMGPEVLCRPIDPRSTTSSPECRRVGLLVWSRALSETAIQVSLSQPEPTWVMDSIMYLYA